MGLLCYVNQRKCTSRHTIPALLCCLAFLFLALPNIGTVIPSSCRKRSAWKKIISNVWEKHWDMHDVALYRIWSLVHQSQYHLLKLAVPLCGLRQRLFTSPNTRLFNWRCWRLNLGPSTCQPEPDPSACHWAMTSFQISKHLKFY